MTGADLGGLIHRDGVRLALWSVVAAAVALVHNRLWATPNLAFFTAIADHLGDNPFGNGADGEYLLTNLVGPTVARALGQTNPFEYARLHLAVATTGCAAVIVAAFRRFGYRAARNLVIVLAAAPATTVTMEWLGQPDAFTLPLALGVVVARRRPIAAILAVIVGLTHAEQGVIIALVAMIARNAIAATIGSASGSADEPAPVTAPATGTMRSLATEGAWLLGAVGTGAALTRLVNLMADVVVHRPRTAYLDLGIDGFASHHAKGGVWLVYGLWGPLWLALIWVAVQLHRRGPGWPPPLRRAWVMMAGAAAAALLPVLITLDETRVYSMTTAPLLVAAAVCFDRGVPPFRPERPGALVLAITLAIPGMFTAGEAYVSLDLPVGEFVRFLQDGRHPGELTPWLLGPFGFEIPEPSGRR